MTEPEAVAEVLPFWRGLAAALAATDPEAAAALCRATVEAAEAAPEAAVAV